MGYGGCTSCTVGVQAMRRRRVVGPSSFDGSWGAEADGTRGQSGFVVVEMNVRMLFLQGQE